MPDHGSDLYGNSKLIEETDDFIGTAFSSSASPAVPLGHSPTDRAYGTVFNFGPNGDPGHALTFGTTRSGKGVSTIIPALLTYGGSMLVLDPKLENAWITAPHR